MTGVKCTARYCGQRFATRDRGLAHIERAHPPLLGLLWQARARSTGTLVQVFDSLQQGLDDNDGTTPYTLSCDTHGRNIAVETVAQARTFASVPEQWCEVCQGTEHPDREDGSPVNPHDPDYDLTGARP